MGSRGGVAKGEHVCRQELEQLQKCQYINLNIQSTQGGNEGYNAPFTKYVGGALTLQLVNLHLN